MPANPAQSSLPAYCETGRPALRRTCGLAALVRRTNQAAAWLLNNPMRTAAGDAIRLLTICFPVDRVISGAIMFDVEVSVSGTRFSVFEPPSNIATRSICARNGFKEGDSFCVASHVRIVEVLASLPA